MPVVKKGAETRKVAAQLPDLLSRLNTYVNWREELLTLNKL